MVGLLRGRWAQNPGFGLHLDPVYAWKEGTDFPVSERGSVLEEHPCPAPAPFCANSNLLLQRPPRAWTTGKVVSTENWPLPGQGAGAGFTVAVDTFLTSRAGGWEGHIYTGSAAQTQGLTPGFDERVVLRFHPSLRPQPCPGTSGPVIPWARL